MNAIRQTALLNKRELENATPPSASWHADYRDTAWLYVGGLPLDLSEGDVTTIFSQFGNPTHLNLIRDRESGKSKGFGFLKYEDQRSCDLAVDNLGGAEVLGRLLRVDHTRYKQKDGEGEDDFRIDVLEALENGNGSENRRASDTESEGDSRAKKRRRRRSRKTLKEERELDEILALKDDDDDDEQDPMRDYLIKEKTEQVERARERRHKHRHRHRHRHRDGGDNDNDDNDEDDEAAAASDDDRRHRHRHRRRDEGDSREGKSDQRERGDHERRTSRSRRERQSRSFSPSDDAYRSSRRRSASPPRRSGR